MVTISKIIGREILDSRGNPTVEVDLFLSQGAWGRASVPSGASTGSHEAVELRDGDKRYGGLGVSNAISNINQEISDNLSGKSFDQSSLDEALIKLDGTENKSRLGANAILGVSMAFARAVANHKQEWLFQYCNSLDDHNFTNSMPVPFMNVLNGGRHASGSTDFQEFMIVPHGFNSFKEALQAGSEVFHALKSILVENKFSTTVGDEGGFAPSLGSNEQALVYIMEAIVKAGYEPGKQISLAIDVAASEFYKDGKYDLTIEQKSFSSNELIDLYTAWIAKYPIISIEDGLAEDDWDGWKVLTAQLGNKIQLVGDDLFVTNSKRLARGIDEKAANSILIKLNQIGTISETVETISLAKKAGYKTIVSHRSGETEDSFIADFAVGLGVDQIKTGSLSRSERVAKYNQLLRIEELLGNKAHYSGLKLF